MQTIFKVLTRLTFISAIFVAVTSYAESAKFCPGASDNVEKLISEKLLSYEGSFGQDSRHMFFVGLWVKLEDSEKRELSIVIHKDIQEMLEGVQVIMQKLSERLFTDRQALAVWIRVNNLEAEIEIQSLPADGSFLLLKATRSGIARIQCASSLGELPTFMSRLGY